ncbi:MAG: hypothetical protein K0S11_1574 [Gammaproteobacteria bacterium]|jgi:hypothetical protein|nr:hypothetical protein [Gammaproteobacteria bacterium]
MPIVAELPPMQHNPQGESRKVGFEIEFTGISLETTAQIIAGLYAGDIQPIHRNRIKIKTKAQGDFIVELDVKLLQRLSQEVCNAATLQTTEQIEIQLKQFTVDMLSPMLVNVAPTEIVTPPLPFSELATLDELCQRLRKNFAKGTHASIIYAFGVHINPEVPAFDVSTLQRYLLAFVLLYDWLKVKSQLDFTRQATQFAKAYPKAYVELLINKTYQDLDTLIDDYLLHNPTRNRALDMLPLFSYLNAKKVKTIIPDERIKARPTFHYRLPNCQIDEPNWSILQSWNLWVAVEKLAYHPQGLQWLSERYKSHLSSLLYNLNSDAWVAEVEAWLGENP